MQNGDRIAKSFTGARRDIMTLWDSLQWEQEVYFYANHWIPTILCDKYSILRFFIFNIYMANIYMDKIECWISLFSIEDTLDISTIIVARDLNTILQNLEKISDNCVQDPM